MRRDHANALAAAERDLLRRGISAVHRKDVRVAASALLAHSGRPVSHIARAEVCSFLAARRETGISPRTQGGELSRLRTFFTALVRVGIVHADPTERLKQPQVRPAPHRLVSGQDVARLLAASLEPVASKERCHLLGCVQRVRAAPDREGLEACLVASAKRDRAALEVLYGLGLRSAEARAALVVDLDLNDGTLLVRRAKRGQPERLPLAPSSLPHLRAWLDARPLLARGEDEGRLLVRNDGRPYDHASQVSKLLDRVMRRVGLLLHPHALRRGVATHLVRAGTPMVVVQHLLGHVNLETTAIYVEVERADLRRAVATLDREPVASPTRGGHRAPGAEASA